MSWVLNHLTPIFAISLPVYGLVMGLRLAARLWRDGWGPVSRETMLSAYGGGVICWLIFAIFAPSSGLLRLSYFVALAGIFVPTLVVIFTRPETPKVTDPEI